MKQISPKELCTLLKLGQPCALTFAYVLYLQSGYLVLVPTFFHLMVTCTCTQYDKIYLKAAFLYFPATEKGPYLSLYPMLSINI